MENDQDARLIEKKISSREIFTGKLLNLRVDAVLLPDGEQATREVVAHPRAVVVLPVTDQNEVIMVRQFRYPVGEVLLELPAGKRDAGEPSLECGRRELAEETGYTAREWHQICSFYTSPGFSDELICLLSARGLQQGEAHPDNEEFIDTVTISLDQARQMIRSGEIRDGKTIIGILALQALGV